MRLGGVGAVCALAVIGTATTAHAEAWGFDWVCAGACAPGSLDVTGHEGPFASESACERARTQKSFEVNTEGSAGTTGDCVDASAPGAPASAHAGGPVRAARLARAYLAVDGGTGYTATYADGRTARGAAQVGGELELLFGRDAIAIGLEAGLRRDAGTAATAGEAAEPMWLVDLGVGIASSPFAFVRRPRFELRPDLGAFYVWAIRTGCGARCETDIVNPQPVGPDQGNTFRLRAGLDLYWGAKNQGLALDALIQFGRLGDLDDDVEPTSVELAPPRVLVRLSYVRRPRWLSSP